MSGEHVFSDWLREYIPRELTEHRIESVLTFPDLKEQSTIKRRTGDPHSRKIPCVCEPCNNGWMSQLQTQVKPFLIPLLTGRRTNLHPRVQRILAIWIAMTVMVGEYLESSGAKATVAQSDRTLMREKQQLPPDGWRIWIGAHARQQHPLYSHRNLTLVDQKVQRAPIDGIPQGNTQTTTICLGKHLVIFAMSSSDFPRVVGRWRIYDEVRSAIDQIWPLRNRSVQWPKKNCLTDAGLKVLTEQFYWAAATLAKNFAPPPAR